MNLFDLRLSYSLLTLPAAIASLTVGLQANADPSYTVTPIPMSTQYPQVFGECINNSGTVAGEYSGFGGSSSAKMFVDTAGVVKIIEPLTGDKSSILGGEYALNNGGLVVGTSMKKNASTSIAYKKNVRFNLIPAPPYSIACCVNDNNLIVGEGGGANDIFFYQYPSGTTTLVTLPPGSTESMLTSMNNRGNVVGLAINNVRDKGFLYSQGAFTILPVPKGFDIASPAAINASNLIAGTLYTSSTMDIGTAAIYSGGIWTPLPVPDSTTNSEVASINDSGDAVGDYFSSNFSGSHAFVYTGGVFYDLNDLLPSLGYTLTEAASINDHGQIVANYLAPNGYASTILTPSS